MESESDGGGKKLDSKILELFLVCACHTEPGAPLVEVVKNSTSRIDLKIFPIFRNKLFIVKSLLSVTSTMTV